MNLTKIDLKDYVKSGEGATGDSYDSLLNPDEMLKLFNPGFPIQPVYDELTVAKKVYKMGVPSPEPGEMVTDGERIGIRFKRIVGKRSFSRMLADEPERTEEFAREFARFSKKLHAMECPEGEFPDVKDLISDALDKTPQFTDDERKALTELLAGLPDRKTAVHGDLHIGNVISTLPKGAPLSVPHETYFIDLGFFTQGHPIFDIAALIGAMYISTEAYVSHDLHITLAQSQQFVRYFLDEYFFSEDRLAEEWFGGSCRTVDSVIENMKKAYLVKFITVTYVLGRKLPEYEEVLDAFMKTVKR